MKISKHLFILFLILITVFSLHFYLLKISKKQVLITREREGFLSFGKPGIPGIPGMTGIPGITGMPGISNISSEKIRSEGIDNIKKLFTDLDNSLKLIPGIFDKISIDFTRLPKTTISR
jgi:hypothetical protein